MKQRSKRVNEITCIVVWLYVSLTDITEWQNGRHLLVSLLSPCSVVLSVITETANTIFNICCPLAAIFVSNGHIFYQKQKSVGRCKESFQKSRNNSSVRHISTLIKVEIKRIDTTLASQLLIANNNQFLRQELRLLCRKKMDTKMFCRCRQHQSCFHSSFQLHPSHTMASI